MFYHFKLHKESPGFWAKCLELDGCATQGDTKEKLEKNMHEALNLYLDEPAESNLTFPLPDNTLKGRNIIAVPVEPEIAIAVLVRYYRHDKGLSQNQAAKLLGMKDVFPYQRLEKKHNPKLSTLKKLKEVFPEISIDAILQVK